MSILSDLIEVDTTRGEAAGKRPSPLPLYPVKPVFILLWLGRGR
jgi:hypothetical protein